jgi:sec-independent protein translocase protein TatA
MVAVGLSAPPKPRYPRCMSGWFGPWELLIVLAVVLLIFGPRRLPQLGRSLGRGAREFRDSIRGRHDKAEADELAELPPPDETEADTPSSRERERV